MCVSVEAAAAMGGAEALKTWRYATSKKLCKSVKNLTSSPLLNFPNRFEAVYLAMQVGVGNTLAARGFDLCSERHEQVVELNKLIADRVRPKQLVYDVIGGEVHLAAGAGGIREAADMQHEVTHDDAAEVVKKIGRVIHAKLRAFRMVLEHGTVEVEVAAGLDTKIIKFVEDSFRVYHGQFLAADDYIATRRGRM